MKKDMAMYFDDTTRNKIIQYIKLRPNQHDSEQVIQCKIDQRNNIFQLYIYQPFKRIAQCLIHKYKYYYYDGQIQQYIHDVTTHLYQKLDHYNYKEFENAFGFFSVIAKYYLIQSNTKNYKQICRTTTLLDQQTNQYNKQCQLEYNDVDIVSKINATKTLILIIQFLEQNKQFYFKTQKQLQVIQALIFLLKQILSDEDLLEQFDKKNATFKQLLSILKQMVRCDRYYAKRVLDKLSNILKSNNIHYQIFNF